MAIRISSAAQTPVLSDRTVSSRVPLSTLAPSASDVLASTPIVIRSGAAAVWSHESPRIDPRLAGGGALLATLTVGLVATITGAAVPTVATAGLAVIMIATVAARPAGSLTLDPRGVRYDLGPNHREPRSEGYIPWAQISSWRVEGGQLELLRHTVDRAATRQLRGSRRVRSHDALAMRIECALRLDPGRLGLTLEELEASVRRHFPRPQ